MHKLIPKVIEEVEKYSERHKITGTRKDELMEKVRQIYKRSYYDSEEPMGVVTAQSLSEPATQMSVDGDEKVILKHNGIIRVVNYSIWGVTSRHCHKRN